jgi:hypothetical protein
MTFAEARDAILATLYPEGAAENLLDRVGLGNRVVRGPYSRYMEEALSELQLHVPCLRVNNRIVYTNCTRYFRCGATVVPAPDGIITAVYTVEKKNKSANPDTLSELDWCNPIHYEQVNYHRLVRYFDRYKTCAFTGVGAALSALCSSGMGLAHKYVYPEPDDAEQQSKAPLPMGFRYPATDTDAVGRSPFGYWALHAGLIYIVPWVQTTEAVFIEFHGIKRFWNDADTLPEHPMVLNALRAYVGMMVAMNHEPDSGRYNAFKAQYYGLPDAAIPGALPTLVYECSQRTKLRGTYGEGTLASASGASVAGALPIVEGSYAGAPTVGSGTGGVGGGVAGGGGVGGGTGGTGGTGGGGGTGGVNVFYNDRRTATATCPAGKTGAPAVGVVEAGEVQSTISTDDANARADSLALQRAQAQLQCQDAPTEYTNDEVSYTASCIKSDGAPDPVGTPVTIVVDAGTFKSTVSKADANAAAYAHAEQVAWSTLRCAYKNRAKSVSVTCSDSSTCVGTVDEGEMSYVVENSGKPQHESAQAAVDSLAQNTAQSRANECCAARTAPPGGPGGGGGSGSLVVKNTEITESRVYVAKISCGMIYCDRGSGYGVASRGAYGVLNITVKVRVPAGEFSAATQEEANELARSAARGFLDSYSVIDTASSSAWQLFGAEFRCTREYDLKPSQRLTVKTSDDCDYYVCTDSGFAFGKTCYCPDNSNSISCI